MLRLPDNNDGCFQTYFLDYAFCGVPCFLCVASTLLSQAHCERGATFIANKQKQSVCTLSVRLPIHPPIHYRYRLPVEGHGDALFGSSDHKKNIKIKMLENLWLVHSENDFTFKIHDSIQRSLFMVTKTLFMTYTPRVEQTSFTFTARHRYNSSGISEMDSKQYRQYHLYLL